MGKFKKTRRGNVRRHNKSRRVQTGGNGVNYTEKIKQKENDKAPEYINVYFGDLLHVKSEELDKLYNGLKDDIAPLFADEVGIKLMKTLVPGFETSNPYPNILCATVFALGMITKFYGDVQLCAKGGFAMQNVSSDKQYASSDIDFFMKIRDYKNSTSDEYRLNKIQQIGAFLQSMINGCIQDKKLVVMNMIRRTVDSALDDSSVLKISIQQPDGKVTSIIDISYIPNKLTRILYSDAIPKTMNMESMYAPIIRFPTIHKLLSERMFYIDKFTSSGAVSKPSDMPFKCSIVRSIQHLLSNKSLITESFGEPTIDIDHLDILMNYYIDTYYEDDSIISDLRERINGFMLEYNTENCAVLKSRSRTQAHP